MISQFFILSPRGDTILLRDYLSNVPKVWVSSLSFLLRLASSEPVYGILCQLMRLLLHKGYSHKSLLFKDVPQPEAVLYCREARRCSSGKVKFWDGGGHDAPPVFKADGVNYLHVKVCQSCTFSHFAGPLSALSMQEIETLSCMAGWGHPYGGHNPRKHFPVSGP